MNEDTSLQNISLSDEEKLLNILLDDSFTSNTQHSALKTTTYPLSELKMHKQSHFNRDTRDCSRVRKFDDVTRYVQRSQKHPRNFECTTYPSQLEQSQQYRQVMTHSIPTHTKSVVKPLPEGYVEYRAPDLSGWRPKYFLPEYPPPVSKDVKIRKIKRWLEKRKKRVWDRQRKCYPARHDIAMSRKRRKDGRFS